MLGALPRECVRRIEPAGALGRRRRAARRARRPRRRPTCTRVSGGNPFFVTEALAAPAGERARPACATPSRCASTRSARRRARCSSCAAVVPGATELALVGARTRAAIDECIDAGLLRLRGETLALPARPRPPRGRGRDLAGAPARARPGACWRALEARGDADPARLVHHARRAGDADAIRRLAPAAARAASAARGHRQALEHWEAALRGRAATTRRRWRASRSRRTCAGARSARSRRAARCSPIHEAAGDALAHRRRPALALARAVVDRARARRRRPVGDRAIAVLEAFPDSRELALALSGRSQLAMLGERRGGGDRARHARGRARPRGSTTTRSSPTALTNVGTALIGGPETRARARAARGGVRARRGHRPRRPRRAGAGEPRDRRR